MRSMPVAGPCETVRNASLDQCFALRLDRALRA